MKRVINTTNAPAALGPYSQAIEAKAILKEAGYEFKDVVSATVYIKDMNDFTKINGVYDKYLGEVKPARACVEVARLPKDVKVEIGVIAVK